jgi:hypothetical protein
VIIALVPFAVVQQSKGVGARKKPKKRGGIRENPHSSLAVFYVEQVALNRHVFVGLNARIESAVTVSIIL